MELEVTYMFNVRAVIFLIIWSQYPTDNSLNHMKICIYDKELIVTQ